MNYRSIIAALAAGSVLAGCSTWNGSVASVPSRVYADTNAVATVHGLSFVESSRVKAQLAVTFEASYQVSPTLVYVMGNAKK